MSDSNPLLEQAILNEALRDALLAEVPEGATGVEMATSAVTAMQRDRAWALFPDGRRESIPLSDLFDSGPVSRLREVMYRDGAGTWFSAQFVVTRAGELRAHFDYDDEPEWPAPVDPIVYADDQDRFPRDVDSQPAWLRRQIADGRRRLGTH